MTSREPPEELKYYQEAYRHSAPAEGKAAGDHSSMANVNNLPSALPALSGPQVCALYQFLQLNGNFSLVPTREDGDFFVYMVPSGGAQISQLKWLISTLRGALLGPSVITTSSSLAMFPMPLG